MSTILDGSDPADPALMGGKAAALARLQALAEQVGAEVPAWFVVSPAAFEASAGAALLSALRESQGASVPARLLDALELEPQTARRLDQAVEELEPGWTGLAVRSSAVDEDGAEASFAGQLESYLGVPPARVAERVADVWRSGFSERVLVYRREQGLDPLPTSPAVLVQRMIDPQSAGVAFAADPVSGRRHVAVVSAVVGLGNALVSGDADADTFRVDLAGRVIERTIAHKAEAERVSPSEPSGVCLEAVEQPDAPALSDADVARVAALARAVSRAAGVPQDIEWAIGGGRLYLLQSRPITSLGRLPDPDGPRVIWDNANIVESYPGVTTPLTFSFALSIYEGVYRQFCLMMSVPQQVIDANASVFARMLGLIRGRIYYNLLNWYRLIAMLPGFHANRTFMEQMMGVAEPLPEELVREIASSEAASRLGDQLRFVRAVVRLAMHQRQLPNRIGRFYHRLQRALDETGGDLSSLRLDQLIARYDVLERRLLKRWDAPLINDFLAMIFFGVLRKLCASWCGDEDGTLQNDLITAEGDIVSAEPARRIRAMAELAASDAALCEALCQGTSAEALAAVARLPALDEQLAAYRERFGDRCLEELKLESATLVDDPSPLLRAIGFTAQRQREGRAPAPRDEGAVRRAAEQRVARSLRGPKRWLFDWVLRNARSGVRQRENLRFERTRLFGRVRRLMVEAGRRLRAERVLDEARDVFYLTLDELRGYIDGAAPAADLGALARARKAEFAGYRDEEPPAERFETRGAVHIGNRFEAIARPLVADDDPDALTGSGCFPGVIRGRVRVIRDPRREGVTMQAGEILVARSTDPGWIMLFPLAAGVLVERGSLLSHSAIVAREMGIPAIVAIGGLMSRLQSGDEVEMDGASGRVRVLERAADDG